jgi:uncharacterized membrane protein YfcA
MLRAGMTPLVFTLLVAAGSFGAGFLGSLVGMGGGVVIVPMLVVLMGIDVHYAMGAALVSVIATSSGAASAYVKEGFTNLRIGMFLEVATTIGALVGATLVQYLPARIIAFIFGLFLAYTTWASLHPPPDGALTEAVDPLAERLKLRGHYPTAHGPQAYHGRRVLGGFGVMFIAGNLSGLLGAGAGAFKVIAMDQVMRLPFKVSTTTSNFMIGVTAAASAGIYLSHGYIDAALAAPVTLGVLGGSFLGARILPGTKSGRLRLIFAAVTAVLAVEMILRGVRGGL